MKRFCEPHLYKPEDSSLILKLSGLGSPSILRDLSRYGNNGAITAIKQLRSPIGKSCLSFDGSTSYARIPYKSSFGMVSNMSAFLWVKSPYCSFIMGQYDTGLNTRKWGIGTDVVSESRMRVLLSADGLYGAASSKDYLTTDNVFDNNWHLVGFTWNAGTLKLYVDGKEQAVTKTHDFAFTTLYASTADFTAGTRLLSGTPNGFFLGTMGDIFVHNKTLSPMEAMKLYDETKHQFGK